MALVFKVKLEGTSKPPVWRKIKINETDSFEKLHLAIQGAFGWENYHLYQFAPGGWGARPVITTDYDEDFDDEPLKKRKDWPNGEKFDAESIKLADYFSEAGQKITYIYDFGDNWEHKVELTEVSAEKTIRPICVGGKGKCPPEDCGSIWGYYNLVEAINDTKHPEHKGMLEWLGMRKGDKWDVNEFDLDEANEGMVEME